ncbi:MULTISPECIES: helix-turn-helix domain-containing protein [unclassified Exiguobacterium]|uniref:helix-turn-helix domain-containing protein n=1 Tax=unclassified Exiguobacterium TaxID=2644629 RepID=UPI0025BFF4C3|nr:MULTISPECIES: helix-turn-helix domain-containing protein [unclassified Exiguobacterium]
MQETIVLTFTPEQLKAYISEIVRDEVEKSAGKVWFSESEAQDYTGYSKRTLYNARIDKTLKASMVNRHARYHRDDLDAWMRSKQN